MATRDLLRVIRAARSGDAIAQCALGKHYLNGGGGLPRNVATALHWLDRAARHRVPEAWMLIGEHVPVETARQSADIPQLLVWYENAFNAGVTRAGLTYAQLILGHEALNKIWHDKAVAVLHAVARAGNADAQWLLAQHTAAKAGASPSTPTRSAALPGPTDSEPNPTPLEWAASAADAGILAARYALADRAWASADYTAFLHWSLPIAREVLGRFR